MLFHNKLKATHSQTETKMEKICKENKILKHELEMIIRRFCADKGARMTNLGSATLPKLCAAAVRFNVPVLEIKKIMDAEKAETKRKDDENDKEWKISQELLKKRQAKWENHPHKMAFVIAYVEHYCQPNIAENMKWNEENGEKMELLKRGWHIMMSSRIEGLDPRFNYKIDENSYMYRSCIIENQTTYYKRITRLSEVELSEKIEQYSSGFYFNCVLGAMYRKTPTSDDPRINRVFVPTDIPNKFRCITIK